MGRGSPRGSGLFVFGSRASGPRVRVCRFGHSLGQYCRAFGRRFLGRVGNTLRLPVGSVQDSGV
eukprot:11190753-Lingulodinium_polyedra.AAC.1